MPTKIEHMLIRLSKIPQTDSVARSDHSAIIFHFHTTGNALRHCASEITGGTIFLRNHAVAIATIALSKVMNGIAESGFGAVIQ